jgi:hypothetical protein
MGACSTGRRIGIMCGAKTFLTERTEDGRQLRILVVSDEFTRECAAIEVARSFTARDVIMTLQCLFAVRVSLGHLRSDNGPEFVAKEIQKWQASRDHAWRFVPVGDDLRRVLANCYAETEAAEMIPGLTDGTVNLRTEFARIAAQNPAQQRPAPGRKGRQAPEVETSIPREKRGSPQDVRPGGSQRVGATGFEPATSTSRT